MFPWLSRLRAMRHLPRWPAPYQAWNIKVLGSALARQRYEAGLAGPGAAGPPEPVAAGLQGGLCRQADIEAPWLQHWCNRLHIAPLYHRKVWEDCYVLQALWDAGMLFPGRRGLGFAVGVETLPAFLASQGVDVLGTDLAPTRREAQVWQRSGQHGGNREQLFHPHLIDRARFDARVTHRDVDMNHIPPDLADGFDFCWSVCALEHLGSIERGLAFVRNAMRCLRPGGIAVHTMEFNLHPAQSGRLRRGSTVLFEEADILALRDGLHAAGHTLLPVVFDRGDGILDGLIDVPPYDAQGGWPATMPRAPHLHVQFRGHAITSLGIIVRAAGAAPLADSAAAGYSGAGPGA